MNATQTWTVIKQSASEWSEDKAMRLAAALACYTIISMAPLVVITMKIVSWTMGPQVAQGQVQHQMEQLVGSAGADAIKQMAAHASQPGAGVIATIVSFIILLFSASGVFAELQDSMNTIWEVKPRPNMGWMETIKKRFLSIGMVFAIIFLLLVSMFITAALGGFVNHIFGGDQKGVIATIASYVVDFFVTVLITGVLFTCIFKFLPDVKVRFRDVWLGGLVTAVLFKVGQYLLALYFYKGSPQSAYGAVGSIVAVLLWAYYSACILFFGAEFTQVYAKQFGQRIVPDADAVPVTDEERAQHGMPRQEDLVTAAKAQANLAGQRGGVPQWAVPPGTVPQRRVVTITRPTVESEKAYALAGLGLAAGFVVGAVGLMTGRKYTAGGLKQIALNERLNALEARYGRGKQLQRNVIEARIHESLDAMEQRVRHAADDMKRRAHTARRQAAKSSNGENWFRRAADAVTPAHKHKYHRPRWLQKLDEFVSA